MHIVQVGVGSGGVVVLDLLFRDPAITHITLIDSDVYAAHNVHRHLFPHSAIGQPKCDLAASWARERRPELLLDTIAADITDPKLFSLFAQRIAECDIGVCAVDNEPAKFAYDALMRIASKPWTLGEVLSGGIGGWVHRFVPGGACYGCISSFLQRTVSDTPAAPPPNYANARGPLAETTIPASKASISAIASLHAAVTLEMLSGDSSATSADSCSSLLFSLKTVSGIFEEAFRSFRFRIPRSPTCLVCSAGPEIYGGPTLDVAVDQALGRLAPQ
jgi:molybdopterin/thiamine biosynthesis adenylyltransferase